MEVPGNLKYTKDHEWVRDEGGGKVRVGITHHAQDALGDIVYYEPPADGADVQQGAECAVIESVKAASEVYAPVSGEVVETNEAVVDSPELVNSSPYEDGWLLVIRLSDPGELDDLLTPEEYKELLESE